MKSSELKKVNVKQLKTNKMKTMKNNENLVNNSNQILPTIKDGDFEIKVPSKKWLDDYMINNIQYSLITMVESSIDKILEGLEEEIQEMWSDCDYRLNFPYQSLEEILDYYNKEYLDESDSELISKLKRYLREERTKLYNVRKDWSKEEIEFEEYITR